MNLPGNGDRTIAKLGETLTGVSINKPLIRKKEARQGQQHRGRISMARSHLYSGTALWWRAVPHGGFTNGTGSPNHSRPALAESWPILWLRTPLRLPPPPLFTHSPKFLPLPRLFFFLLFPSSLLSFSRLLLSAPPCPECAAVLRDFTMIDCGVGPPLPRWERKWRREKRREGNGQSREAWRERVYGGWNETGGVFGSVRVCTHVCGPICWYAYRRRSSVSSCWSDWMKINRELACRYTFSLLCVRLRWMCGQQVDVEVQPRCWWRLRMALTAPCLSSLCSLEGNKDWWHWCCAIRLHSLHCTTICAIIYPAPPSPL